MMFYTHADPALAAAVLDDATLRASTPTSVPLPEQPFNQREWHRGFYIAACAEHFRRFDVMHDAFCRAFVARYNRPAALRFTPMRPTVTDIDLSAYTSIWRAWRHVLRMRWYVMSRTRYPSRWTRATPPDWDLFGDEYTIAYRPYAERAAENPFASRHLDDRVYRVIRILPDSTLVIQSGGGCITIPPHRRHEFFKRR